MPPFGRQIIDPTLPENILAAAIIDAAYRVYQALGPGLLEFVYEGALAHELTKQGIEVRCQVPIDVIYDGIVFGAGLRLDLLVSDLVIVELKSVESLSPVHAKILLTYLRCSGKKLGLILNFSDRTMKQGIRRVVNGL
ncbi:MAG TPA: GxxExxY protein [Fimbriimonadaceae bacterium]|jgi:GxxExxY protein